VLFLCRFHPNNVLGIRSFADTLGCYALITEADRYIHQYFHDVSVADEYLNLTCPALLSMLQSDELHVFSEEQVGVSGQYCYNMMLSLLTFPVLVVGRE
jgi:kelch-like protein 18